MFRTLILTVAILWPVVASAQQILESAGSRALGMAGAFVGVADDATAVYWNPAGLAVGPPAGMTIGWVDFRTGNQSGPTAPGPTRRTSKFVSLGAWPLGLSYGTSEESGLVSGLEPTTNADNFRLSHFGATLVQTLLPGLVVGSTVKYLRGTPVSGPIRGLSAGEALDAAREFKAPSTGRFDLDLGLMADLRRARVGLVLRNLREPRFGADAGSAIQLKRHARLGLAVLPTAGVTLAMDLDLDTVALRDGPRRMLALGAEDRIGRRFALRGGMRWSLKGSRRAVAAVGGSVALRPSLWLDWHLTGGRIDADRGFGVALRVGS